MKQSKHRLYTAIAFALMMGLLMSGCSKQVKQETKEDTKKTETTDSKKTDTQETKKEEETEIPYEKGVRTDLGYESAWMNLRFTTPENARLATEEEVQQMYNTGADALDLEEKQSSELEEVYEMLAVGADNASNVTLTAIKIPLSAMTEETYLSVALKSLEQIGAELTYQSNGEITDAVIAGQNFKKGILNGTYQGNTITQELYAKKNGSYIILITATYYGDGAEKDNLLNAFQPFA